ncbi:hypothetical protein GALMADRAFT_147681 [Galerina marginata CBS 339.88]|uniref:Uncharacterized protein n=1 Tax=Galerina marginata (strain CBS 339.88) TaxID=685588 RepID=A0A067S706_GALM3|nr:hypothetical protein GALMADRAFT_147681 [Galerina marginata CBS 339.88]
MSSVAVDMGLTPSPEVEVDTDRNDTLKTREEGAADTRGTGSVLVIPSASSSIEMLRDPHRERGHDGRFLDLEWVEGDAKGSLLRSGAGVRVPTPVYVLARGSNPRGMSVFREREGGVCSDLLSISPSSRPSSSSSGRGSRIDGCLGGDSNLNIDSAGDWESLESARSFVGHRRRFPQGALEGFRRRRYPERAGQAQTTALEVLSLTLWVHLSQYRGATLEDVNTSRQR